MCQKSQQVSSPSSLTCLTRQRAFFKNLFKAKVSVVTVATLAVLVAVVAASGSAIGILASASDDAAKDFAVTASRLLNEGCKDKLISLLDVATEAADAIQLLTYTDVRSSEAEVWRLPTEEADDWYKKWDRLALIYGRGGKGDRIELLAQMSVGFVDGSFSACGRQTKDSNEVRCVYVRPYLNATAAGGSLMSASSSGNTSSSAAYPYYTSAAAYGGGTPSGISSFVSEDAYPIGKGPWPRHSSVYTRQSGQLLRVGEDKQIIDIRTRRWYRQVDRRYPWTKAWGAFTAVPQPTEPTVALSFSLVNSSGFSIGVGTFNVPLGSFSNYITTLKTSTTPNTHIILLNNRNQIIASSLNASIKARRRLDLTMNETMTAAEIDAGCVVGDPPNTDVYCQMSISELGLQPLIALEEFHGDYLDYFKIKKRTGEGGQHEGNVTNCSTFGSACTELPSTSASVIKRLDLGGAAVWASILQITSTRARNVEWKVVIIVPESDLIGAVKSKAYISGCISGGVVVGICISIAIILRLLLRPLATVVEAMSSAAFLADPEGGVAHSSSSNTSGSANASSNTHSSGSRAEMFSSAEYVYGSGERMLTLYGESAPHGEEGTKGGGEGRGHLLGPKTAKSKIDDKGKFASGISHEKQEEEGWLSVIKLKLNLNSNKKTNGSGQKSRKSSTSSFSSSSFSSSQRTLSYLSDVAAIQKAYWTMVDELQALRGYIPQHICEQVVAQHHHHQHQGSFIVAEDDDKDYDGDTTESNSNHLINKYKSAKSTDHKDNGRDYRDGHIANSHLGPHMVKPLTARSSLKNESSGTQPGGDKASLFANTTEECGQAGDGGVENQMASADPAEEVAWSDDQQGALHTAGTEAPEEGLLDLDEINSNMLSHDNVTNVGLKRIRYRRSLSHDDCEDSKTRDDDEGGQADIKNSNTFNNKQHILRPVFFRDNALVDRDISVACVNIVGFHQYALVTHGSDVTRHHGALVTYLSGVAGRCGGVLDTFSGDKFWVSFNATSKCDGSAVAAACFGLEVAGCVNKEAAAARAALAREHELRLRNEPVKSRYRPRFRAALGGVTVGLATGRAFVGPLGTSTIRRHSIISNAVSEASALERQCGRYPDCGVMVGGDMIPAIEGYCQYLLIDACVLPGSGGLRRRLASLKGLMCGPTADASLLRGLSEPALLAALRVTVNPYRTTNDFFNAFLEGRTEECVRLMTMLDGDIVSDQAARDAQQAGEEGADDDSDTNNAKESSEKATGLSKVKSRNSNNNNGQQPQGGDRIPYTYEQCANISVMLRFVWSMLFAPGAQPTDGRRYKSPLSIMYSNTPATALLL